MSSSVKMAEKYTEVFYEHQMIGLDLASGHMTSKRHGYQFDVVTTSCACWMCSV